MIEGLQKAIRNYILPQFPIIKDFEFKYHPNLGDGDEDVIKIWYFVEDENAPNYFTVTEEVGKVEDLTWSIFKMLNDGSVILRDIGFRKYEAK